MAKVHIGKRIKEVVEKSPISVTDFAANINRSRDVAYKIFVRETIDTGLLQNISKVLEHDFFSYYSHELPMVRDEQAGYIKKTDLLASLGDELKAYKKQLTELEKKYELLEEINKLTKEKLEGLKKKPKK